MDKPKVNVAVSGAAGRMGKTVCEAVESAGDMELTGRADPELGKTVEGVLGDADVLVEFSTPATAADNIRAALARNVHVVVGTSGWDIESVRPDAEESEANVLFCPNFAIGAVLMMVFAKQAAEHLPDAEIIELHHDGKLDKPSGTAKRTAELIAEAGGNVHEPIHSVRLPGLVAHQEVVFGGEGQTLSIRHDSLDRSSFMPGVLLAIRRVDSLPDALLVGLENVL